MGHLGPKGGTQGGAQGSPPKGLYKQRRGGAPSPVCQALGRPRGPSSPDCIAYSRTCGLRGGDALAAQGRAIREEVHATALLASICTTPTRYKFRNRASSGNPVIYNCSNSGLCGRKFLLFLPHIPTAVSRASAISL